MEGLTDAQMGGGQPSSGEGLSDADFAQASAQPNPPPPSPMPPGQPHSLSDDEINQTPGRAGDSQAIQGLASKVVGWAKQLPGMLDRANTSMNEQEAKGYSDPDIDKTLNTPEATYGEAWDTYKQGRQKQGDPNEHGTISRWLNDLTVPEQILAREAVVGLQNVKALPPQQAKQLLSQDEVLAHDVLNAYWKQPSNFGTRVARFGVGLASDILFDPVQWVTLGASSWAKAATVAGQTFSDLSKLSEGEKAIIRGAQAVEKVITADGAVESAEGAEDATASNLAKLKDYANGKIGAPDLFNGLEGLATGVKDQAEAAHQAALSAPLTRTVTIPGTQQTLSIPMVSYFDQWASGEKAVKMGLKVPFTKWGMEAEVPFASYLTKPTGLTVGGILGAARNYAILNNPVGRGLSTVVNSVFTKTMYPAFDMFFNRWLGLKNASQVESKAWAKNWYGALPEGTNFEKLAFMGEYYVPPEQVDQKAAFWAKKTLQEHLDSLPEEEKAKIAAGGIEKPTGSDYKYTPMNVDEPTEGKTFYHGSPTFKVDGNPRVRASISNLESASPMYASKTSNLYGEGQYLTDNPAVADSYANNGHIFSGKLKNLKLLDLERPLPDDVTSVLNKQMPEDATLIPKGTKGTEAYKMFNEAHMDAETHSDHMTEIQQELNGDLASLGYDGFRHEGGNVAGGMGKHNVVILHDDMYKTGAKFGLSNKIETTGAWSKGENPDKGIRAAAKVYSDEFQRLQKKFTFDPAEVRKRFPDDTKGLTDEQLRPQGIEKEFLDDLHAQMDKRAQAMENRPGLHFESFDPRKDGSANNYVAHRIYENWFQKNKNVTNAVEYAYDKLSNAGLNVDKGTAGRSFRGYIFDGNKVSQAKDALPKVGNLPGVKGIKMFIDDPVALAQMRMEEMDSSIRNYDLMEMAGQHAMVVPNGEEAPAGFVKVKKEYFGKSQEENIGTLTNPADELKTSPTGYIWRNFVPPKFVQNEGNLYLPEPIMSRLINSVNPKQYPSWARLLFNVNDGFMRIFRNTALFGPGYVGMKTTSDMISGMSAGWYGNPFVAHVDAARILNPTWLGETEKMFQIASPSGEVVERSGEDLFKAMLEENVVRSNVTQLADIADVGENIASVSQANKTLGRKLSTIADYAFLWRANRAAVKFAEDIPKAALYLDRLRAGYTSAGAAEDVERVFGTFNNVNTGGRVLNQVFPFTSVALKTLEGQISRIGRGEFAQLQIPNMIGQMLQGKYVPDRDVRTNLHQMLPAYYDRAVDRIHGPLLPGQYEVMAELPWVGNTMGFFFNPSENVHPLIKLLGAWGTSQDEKDYTGITGPQQYAIAAGQSLSRLVPGWLKTGLEVAEINGLANFGGVFKDSLMGHFETAALGQSKIDVKVPYNDRNNAYAKNFDDMVDFGEFLEKNRGEEGIYNIIFPSKLDSENPTPTDMYKLAQRGQFIKEHFRDLSLGYASLTSMDKNVAINMGAMRRQYQQLMRDVQEDNQKEGFLTDPAKINDPQFQKESDNPKLKAALDLGDKMESLHAYYNWYISIDKKFGNHNPWALLFGGYNYDNSGKPITMDFGGSK